MRYEHRSLAAFIIIVLFFMGCAAQAAAQTQPPGKAVSSGSAVQEQFHKARTSFLKKDFHDAASEIRSAAGFLEKEETRATGEGKQKLAYSAQDLRTLADRVEKKSVKSERELDESFARAENALARQYHEQASESWAKKEAVLAGERLRAAAAQLENTLAWTGGRIEEKSKRVIQEARGLGEKMEKGANVAASDMGKSLDAVKNEIDEAARKITRMTGAVAIQPAHRPKEAVDLTTAVVRVANQAMPAVVYIEVTESRTVQNPAPPLGNDPFLKRFFGTPNQPRKFKQEMRGLGSGIIIDARGYILTNSHVAAAASSMQVTLADGNQYPATLVGADPRTDLAVIRISAKESLPYVTFGDSDKVEVGEWVVAIGAPRALEKSVTQGIISAMHRTGITDPNSYQDFLQTDASMNPGNSGGPLLNLYGQVIGVNAAIATESGGSEGIGFTIPSRMALYVVNALMAHGKVERGWLGVSIRNLNPELAKEAHVPTLSGALIADVVKGGPAEKAGLKKNDVVIAYGDQQIPDAGTLRNDVAQTPIGSQAKLTVLREGKKEQVTVTIGSLENAEPVMAAVVKERLGAEVRDSTPKEVEQYGGHKKQGVVITRLNAKGPLATAGFEVGDMILAVEGQPVAGTADFIGLVSALPPGKRASFTALDHRTGNTGNIFVMVK